MTATPRLAIPRKLERSLYQQAQMKCPICGNSDISVLTIHHIVPYSQIKAHREEAMIVLCANCHSRAEAGQITIDELFTRKRELTLPKKPEKKQRLEGQTKVVGIIAAGGNVNVDGGIVINPPQKSKPEPPVRPGTVAEESWMIGYLDHLVKRFNDFKGAEMKYSAKRMGYSIIRSNYEHEIGFPLRHTPVTMFEKGVAYLQGRIDRTIVGKRNRNKGIPNYSSFAEWKAKQLG